MQYLKGVVCGGSLLARATAVILVGLPAMNHVHELCVRADLELSMDFRPGDIQFLNNHVTLHSREALTDFPDLAREALKT